VQDIEQGLVRRVIVYKLDRISRSIIDFASMMELFQLHGVEFVSSTEKFDTSTPMGRAMLNICIVFAQLERETIQKRVTDAFYSRAKRGFQVGGFAPFGFSFESVVIDGINTKKLVADTSTAPYVKLMYEMYSDPNVSLGDITRHFAKRDIKIGSAEVHRSTLSSLMKNPVYVQADLEVYEFFKSQGTEVVNDPADFTGLNGCYIYQGRDVAGCKNVTLKDRVLVVAPHEGLVSAEQWLTVRKRLLTTRSFGDGIERGKSRGHKAKNTWLSGKIKCGLCGTAMVYAYNTNKDGNRMGFFRCRKRAETKNCQGPGTMRTAETETLIYNQMIKKMAEFQVLTNSGDPNNPNNPHHAKSSPKLTALNVEMLQVEAEIEKLVNTLTGANPILMSYANTKIEELDTKRQAITQAIATITAKAPSQKNITSITNHLEDWDNTSFDDKRIAIEV